ncbi:hypothetical protein BDV28DRAFT_128033 [Aspergillus coremiiformis]|uniref:Uncharacterized protein n=1 Tax=Aspergillus coremiiformis TaxID=138285 RepID=A0A5N6ZEA1_9EURO|nr:hypothetical protein BDV28DRAFT_128033 [Aspergillus coremiiformis]
MDPFMFQETPTLEGFFFFFVFVFVFVLFFPPRGKKKKKQKEVCSAVDDWETPIIIVVEVNLCKPSD